MSMRKRVPVALSVALTSALVAACASYRAHEPHQRQLTVAPDPVPCADGTPGSCLSITDADGDSWITYVDEIEGFTYEPGYTYHILVEDASEVAEMEADTPPRPKLIQVISREASGAPAPVLDADLDGTRWRLSSVGPSGYTEAEWQASGITVEFDVAKGRLSGSTGCNSYSATVSAAGDDLAVSAPIATRRACPSPTASGLEHEYLENLAKVTAFAVAGDNLDVSQSDGGGMAFHAAGP
jgi:heat shock protein HslJ